MATVKYQGGGASGVSTRFTNRAVTSDVKRQQEAIKTKATNEKASIKSELNVKEQATRQFDRAYAVHNKIREYENEQLAKLPKALQTMAGIWHQEQIEDNKQAVLEGKHKFDLHGHDFKEVLKDSEVSQLLIDTEKNKNQILQRMHDMEVPVEVINRWTAMSPVAQSGFVQRSIQAKGENSGVAFINWKNEAIESGREFTYIGTDLNGAQQPPQTFTLSDDNITPDMWRTVKSEFYVDYSADLPGVKESIKNDLFDSNFNSWGDTFIKEKVTNHIIQTASTNIAGLEKKVTATFKSIANLPETPGDLDATAANEAKIEEGKNLIKNLYGLLRAQNNDLNAAQGLTAGETSHSQSMSDLESILKTAILESKDTASAVEVANMMEEILTETKNPATGISLIEHDLFKDNALYKFAMDHKAEKDKIEKAKFNKTSEGEGAIMIESGDFDKYTDTKDIWAYLQDKHGWNMDNLKGWQVDAINKNIIEKIAGHKTLTNFEWVMKVQEKVSDTNSILFSREDFPGITEEAINTLKELGIQVSDDSWMVGEENKNRIELVREKVKKALYPQASASGLPFSKIQNEAVDAVMFDIMRDAQKEKIEQTNSNKPPQPDHVIFTRNAEKRLGWARKGAKGTEEGSKLDDGSANPYYSDIIDGPQGWVLEHEYTQTKGNMIEALQEIAEIRHSINTVGLDKARKKGILKNNLQLFESDGGIPPVYTNPKKLKVLSVELGYDGTPGNTFDDFIREQGLEQLSTVGESGGTDQSDLPSNLVLQQYMNSPNKEAFLDLVGRDNSKKAVAREIIMANGGAGDYKTISTLIERMEWLKPEIEVTESKSSGILGGSVPLVDKEDAQSYSDWSKDMSLLTDAQDDINKIKNELQPIVNRLDENDLNITFTNSERGNIKRLFMDGTQRGVKQYRNVITDKWNRKEWTKISAAAKKAAAEGNGSYDYYLLKFIRESESYQAQLAK